MEKRQHYEWDDLDGLVLKAAGIAARRYHNYGVTFEDCTNEIYVWLYEHKAKVRGWLSARPQRITRIFRSFADVAIGYGEVEKAARVGYSTEDVAWYSPSMVEGLLPLALDDDFVPEDINDQENSGRSGRPPSESGNLLALVLDVRRALDGTNLTRYFLDNDSSNDVWDSRIAQLVDYLGGNRPMVGRRHIMSNDRAQALTRSLG